MMPVPRPMSDASDGWGVWTILPALLLVLSTLRLLGFLLRFGGESLQMDFAAFYTAGEALNAGRSPYYTHLDTNPPLWDGINEFVTSRFLYPPLAATFFQPWALLGYATAKVLWMALSLLCIGTALFLVNRRVQLHRQPALFLLFGIFVTTYFPLLIYLERGQIDAINLLLLTMASLWLGKVARAKQMGAGLLIALATLFKLQCIYFLPFLLWRRHWWALLGVISGGLLLLALSFWFNGAAALLDYLQVQVPRISRYGDLGAPDAFLDRANWQKLHATLPDGYTIKDGVPYLPESFFFTKNATMVRNLHSIWTKVLGPVQQSVVSLVALAGMAGLLFTWEWLRRPHLTQNGETENFFYWQLVLLIILLTGPMTWVMNLIWLLPLALVLLGETTQPLAHQRTVPLALALVALLILGLPDIYTFPQLVPFGASFMRWHYVFGELLLFGALLVYMCATPALKIERG